MEQARYRTLASFSDIIIFQYNIKEDYLEFSPNVSEYFEIGSDHIEKLRKHELTVVHPEDRTLLFEYFHRAKKTGMPQKWEMRFKNSQDMYFWGECRCQMVGGNGMGPGFLIGTILDISDRKKRELDLLNKANRDGLTGILNKKAIEAGVNDLIKTHGDGFLFMIDLDNFKHVNDTYGHGEGDSLLIRIARMLRSIFREHDPVARVGGDEFIAFMSDTKNQDIARLKVEMIFSKLDEISLETGYDVAASIGIAVCPADGTDFQKLYEAADQAMYQAKKSGKNGYAFTGHEKED